jgi:prepilin-type N-terminal cleavage/methylation domain-containing protein
MDCKSRTNKAFTLIELVVAIGILAIILSFASVIFKVSIRAHRMAVANSEIMQKLRAITSQLNADFEGLRKDGEIFVVWTAKVDSAIEDPDPNDYQRFDRIMFFADGDFQSYRTDPTVPVVHGNLARICYMIARDSDGRRAPAQDKTKRILARSQHILTADQELNDFPDPNDLSDDQWEEWINRYQYDKITLAGWKNISWDNKKDILSAIADVKVGDSDLNEDIRGIRVEPSDADSIHMLLCEGVGEFKIQGWYEAQQQWIPEVDPDGDGDLEADTHFFIPSTAGEGEEDPMPGVLYPYPIYGGVSINHIDEYPRENVDEVHFNSIPGLGRALKFTFTLYDSKGIIEKGQTFTHIVYLDK